MTQDEINLEARSACRFPTGHPEDRGPAMLRLSVYGWVVETPHGVFEVRGYDGKPMPTGFLAAYASNIERLAQKRALEAAEKALHD